MNSIQNAEQQSIKTVFGKFENNNLFNYETEEIISCLTYGVVKKIIEGKKGFYNIKYNPITKCWIIFQYILVDD